MVLSTSVMKPWAEALEQIRGEGSKRSLETSGAMPARQYREMLRESKRGPTLDILGRILASMGCSWTTFGKAYDAILDERGSLKPRGPQTSSTPRRRAAERSTPRHRE